MNNDEMDDCADDDMDLPPDMDDESHDVDEISIMAK